MKTPTINTLIMKKALFFLLFINGLMNAQPVINTNPTPLTVCDDSNNNDGVYCFDLHTKDSEITNGNTNYVVTYYETMIDAQTGYSVNELPAPYCNINNHVPPVYVYARVEDLANPGTFSTCTLLLVVNPLPTATISGGGNYCQNSSGAQITFTGVNGTSPYVFTYQIDNNPTQIITGVGNSATLTIPTTLVGTTTVTLVSVQDSSTTACSSIINSSTIVTINQLPVATINDIWTCSNNLIPLVCNVSSTGTYNYQWYLDEVAISGATTNSIIPSVSGSYSVIVTNSTTGCSTSLSPHQVIINPTPVINQAPNLYIVDNPYDGIATFDLTSNNAAISTNANYSFSYYRTFSDASSGFTVTQLPTIYQNTSNPETIFVRVSDNSTSCYSITSFQLIVGNPNNVYIPDANFKAKLIALGVDMNSDGEIQYSEALVPTSLDVSASNIGDLTGIEAFTNLQSLVCHSNHISIFPISNLINLTSIDCSYNQLVSLDVIGLSNIINLDCDNNLLSTLNVSGLINLVQLSCGNNQLASLDLSGLTNLTYLNCSINQIQTLDVSMLINLQSLYCFNNQLLSLNVIGLTNLLNLYFSNNQLYSIDLSGLTNLQFLEFAYNQFSIIDLNGLNNLAYLNCKNNQINSLNLNGLSNLNQLLCSNNQLQNLDVSGLPVLIYLDCSSNQILTLGVNTFISQLICDNNLLSSINMNAMTNLYQLSCTNNQLTTIDVSNSHQLTYLGCGSPQLNTIFMKNGSVENFTLATSSNLQYICADEGQITSIQAQVPANVVVSSYCSFTPGGSFNTVTGTVRFDMDNNGCSSTDTALPNSVRLNITDSTVGSGTFPTTDGSYTLYTLTGANTLTTSLENPSYFNIDPTNATSNFSTLGNTQTQDFCITANGVHNDLEVVLMPITTARPGFDATYKLVLRNKGNQSLSSWTGLLLNYEASKMSFVSSSITVNTAVAGQLEMGYSINPFETVTILFTFHINSPTDTMPVNIGDILHFNSTISIVNDENIADNTFNYNQTVVGSFDPNSIECLEGNSLDPIEIGNYLHYAVNFENTGTYEAQNVVVKDVIDTSKYDMNTLQIMDSSNPMYVRITNNVVEFIFQNIHLAASSGNPPVGGHGTILFKIKSKNNLVAGDYVEKTADIFFDYNAPIATNVAQTVYTTLSNSIHTIDASISVYPNPTNSVININASNTIKSIELYDVQGRLLQTKLENNVNSKIDITNKQNGIYFLKITSDKGSKVEKIVKE